MVNTCSLRGDWSTANLFTYRLTTQEPLFLPLPSHPPFIPCYLTFPSLASSASCLPSSNPPSTFMVFLSLPNPPPSHPFSHLWFFSCLLPQPRTATLSTSPIMAASDKHQSLHHVSPNAFFLPPSSVSPPSIPVRLTRIGIRSVSVSFCGLRYFS